MATQQAVTRVTTSDGWRMYFDADEQIVAMKRRCRTCGAYGTDGEEHIAPCSPEQSLADSLDRLNASLYRLRNR